MAAATKAKDPAAAAADAVRFIAAAQNPANTPLSPGLTADPTYLAFLRGAGFSQQEAQTQALAQIAQARAAYATQSARLPEQLTQARENTDNSYANGAFFSGERLVDQNRNTVANQEHGQDLLSTATGAYAGAQSDLQKTLADLARQRADAEGGLQDRQRQQSNQDRYISAVAGSRSGGGGGGVTINIPTPAGGVTTQPVGAPKPAGPAAPLLGAGQKIGDYLNSVPLHSYLGQLDNAGQGDWLKFMQAQYPTADFAPVLQAIAGIQASRQQSNQAQSNLRTGNRTGY